MPDRCFAMTSTAKSSSLCMIGMMGLLSTCNQDNRIIIPIFIEFSSLPEATRQVILNSSLNGVQLKNAEVLNDIRDFGLAKLSLDPSSTGSMRIIAEVKDAGHCLLASGSGEILIPEQREIHIPITKKPVKDTYTLTVNRDDGTYFTIDPPLAPGECSGGSPCSLPKLCGAKIKINPSMANGNYTTWKGDCINGELICELTMDRDHVVYLQSSSQVCTQEGWCWQNIVPQGLGLRAIFGFSEQDMWVVGEHGTILHWDGKNWDTQPSGIQSTLHGLWGSDPNDLWAGSWDGTLLHRSGDAWKIEKKLSNINITTLWGDGANLWVGGWGGIYRKDNKGNWAQEVTDERIWAIWGGGPNDVWAVGARGHILHKKAGVNSWANVHNPIIEDIWGIWGSSKTEIWAITRDFILKYDHNNNRWNIDGKAPARPGNYNAIWGNSRDDVWVSGNSYSHWNGLNWQEDLKGPTRVGILVNGIWGADKDNVWFVGAGGEMRHWDGATLSSANARLTSADLETVWANGKNDIWTVSEREEVFYWNGRQWLDRSPRDLPRREAVSTPNLWGLPAAGIVWYATPSGALLRWTGAAWDKVQPSPPVLVTDVWGTSERDLWVTGTDGSAARFDGKNWAHFVVSAEGGLWKLQGSATDDVWAMGGGCRLFHWDGTNWQGSRGPCGSGPARGVFDMYLAARNDLWFVSGAELWRGDGVLWQRADEINRMAGPIWGIWGTGTSDVWAVGTGPSSQAVGSALGHWNGTKWSLERCPLDGGGAKLAGLPGQDVWMVGRRGMILRKPR